MPLNGVKNRNFSFLCCKKDTVNSQYIFETKLCHSVEQPPFLSRVFFQGVNGVQPFTNLVKGMHIVKIFCQRYLYR